MSTLKRRAKYILISAAMAIGFFLVSYHVIFWNIAGGNILAATIWNLAIIFLILIVEKLEIYIIEKISSKMRSKKKHPLFLKFREQWLDDASVKSYLYCFYIGVLVCSALIAADPYFPVLGGMSDYFLSTRYGILVLVAVDKFLEQVFKDLKEWDEWRDAE